jgi:hydrogenase expression/formation protein HypE
VQKGDSIILTKSAGIEGTAILSHEFEAMLDERGVDRSIIDSGKEYYNYLSILPEAEIAADFTSVHAMHDVTEGGLATALTELSVAVGHVFSIDRKRIRIREETSAICDALGLDPIGLIGSGSLLICCGRVDSEELLDTLRDNNIEAAIIGSVEGKGSGIRAYSGGEEAHWPVFSRDELARMF